MVDIKDIVIDPELEKLLPELSADENAELLASVMRDGFTDPIIVWLGRGILVDGHNRFRIWRDVLNSDPDKDPEVIEKTFASIDDVKEFMLRRQLARRNLTDAMRVTVAMQLKPMLEAKAKAKQARKSADSVRPNSDKQPMRVDEEVAKAAGVGRDTVRKVETVLTKGDDETKAAMLKGETSVNAAHKTVTKPKGKPSTSDRTTKPVPLRIDDLNDIMESLLSRVRQMSPRALRAMPEVVHRLRAYSGQLSALANEIEVKIGGAE